MVIECPVGWIGRAFGGRIIQRQAGCRAPGVKIVPPCEPLTTQDSSVEGTEILQLSLSNPTGGAALGAQSTSTLQILDDIPEISSGIVVNGALSGLVIEQNRAQFELDFIQRPEFVAICGALNNQAYVDRLFLTTGVSVSSENRQALVNGLNALTETRATVLHKLVNGTRVISEGHTDIITTYSKAFIDSQTNAAFVQMEYLGYLRRNADNAGFAFWDGKMNFYGDFTKAEMVKSFLVSPEYLQRFAP